MPDSFYCASIECLLYAGSECVLGEGNEGLWLGFPGIHVEDGTGAEFVYSEIRMPSGISDWLVLKQVNPGTQRPFVWLKCSQITLGIQ